MLEPMSDKHYEEKFEFPLWKMIKQRAEERDISYLAASEEVTPEYVKTIKYGVREFEDAEIGKWADEMAQIEREQPETKF